VLAGRVDADSHIFRERIEPVLPASGRVFAFLLGRKMLDVDDSCAQIRRAGLGNDGIDCEFGGTESIFGNQFADIGTLRCRKSANSFAIIGMSAFALEAARPQAMAFPFVEAE
jgi:hypothetical protein